MGKNKKVSVKSTGSMKCTVRPDSFKTKCKADEKLHGSKCTSIFYSINTRELDPSEKLCCRAWGCKNGNCKKLNWHDIGCVWGEDNKNLDKEIGWGHFGQRPRLRCSSSSSKLIVRWSFEGITGQC